MIKKGMKTMKTKRLLAALLTLLLALSCVTPVLAVKPEGLDRIDIDLPKLPSAGITVEKVLGTTRGPGITYNQEENAALAGENGMEIWYNGKAMDRTDTFTAGQTVYINFMLRTPSGFDIPNDAFQPGTANIELEVPVYLEGTQVRDASVIYVEPRDQLSVTVPYRVEGRVVSVFDVCGLVLPTPGMTVRESLKNVSVRDLTAYQPCWHTTGSDSKKMTSDQTFQAGQTYWFTVSFSDTDVSYKEDANGDAVLETRMDGKSVDATVKGGKSTYSYPTFNWRYTVPESSDPTTPAADAITDIYITGVILPKDGGTVKDSLAKCSAGDLKILSSGWQEVTSDGHLIDLKDSDTFQAGKTYLLSIDMDVTGKTVAEKYDPTPITYAVANVYLNGTKIYNGTNTDPNASLLPYGMMGGGKKLSLGYKATAPAASKTLKDIYITGVVLPEEGLTVYASLMDCAVQDLTELSVRWNEASTGDDISKSMSNTDKFQAGKTYLLTVEIDAADLILTQEGSNTSSDIWVVANVYLNGVKVYNRDPADPAYPGADLTYSSEQGGAKKLIFHYRVDAAEAAGSTFTDVPKDAWYSSYVDAANKMGLVNGMTETTFVPKGELTVAQAVKLAAVMNQKYTTGAVSLTNGTPWYTTYAAYCRDNGILAPDGSSEGLTYDKVMAEPNRPITRGEYAWLFSRALPDEALPARNTIPDGSIPDVGSLDSATRLGIYKLYRAGVVNGNDAKGTFLPASQIKRSEVAAIVVRMMDAGTRVDAPADLGK